MNLGAIPAMLGMIPSVLRGVDRGDLARIEALTRRAYPDVRQISAGELAEWMRAPDALLLGDVRSPEEFAVSHLRGALNLRTVRELSAAVERKKPERVVLYCSVGFRSSRLAGLLAGRGLGGVANLEGSIFRWANEGGAVYRGEVRTDQVHPFGARWAGLLAPGLAGFADGAARPGR